MAAKLFGAHDKLDCPGCNWTMRVVRRSPHPRLGGKYELQYLECARCGHTTTRAVDGDGKPPK